MSGNLPEHPSHIRLLQRRMLDLLKLLLYLYDLAVNRNTFISFLFSYISVVSGGVVVVVVVVLVSASDLLLLHFFFQIASASRLRPAIPCFYLESLNSRVYIYGANNEIMIILNNKLKKNMVSLSV